MMRIAESNHIQLLTAHLESHGPHLDARHSRILSNVFTEFRWKSLFPFIFLELALYCQLRLISMNDRHNLIQVTN